MATKIDATLSLSHNSGTPTPQPPQEPSPRRAHLAITALVALLLLLTASEGCHHNAARDITIPITVTVTR